MIIMKNILPEQNIPYSSQKVSEGVVPSYWVNMIEYHNAKIEQSNLER